MALSERELSSAVHPLPKEGAAYPRPRLLPSPASPEAAAFDDKVVSVALNIPSNLDRKKVVATDEGTWRMKNLGGEVGNIAIFDAHDIPPKQAATSPVENVNSINDYVNDVFEAEEAKKTQPQTVRRPLSRRLKTAVAAVSMALLG